MEFTKWTVGKEWHMDSIWVRVDLKHMIQEWVPDYEHTQVLPDGFQHTAHKKVDAEVAYRRAKAKLRWRGPTALAQTLIDGIWNKLQRGEKKAQRLQVKYDAVEFGDLNGHGVPVELA